MEYLKKQVEDLDKKIAGAKKLLTDPSLSSLADEEIAKLGEEKLSLMAIINREPDEKGISSKAVIIEIRAAAGGDEAGLFAGDLYRMYVRFAAEKGWKTEQISINEGGIGNIKEVVFRIAGQDAYASLKYESGVHRVQRVPHTESSGRIHTSTVTVAVLPEITDQEFHIPDGEIKIETYRSSGHGGQNVQKVETAVRAMHTPTGITASSQNERSQFQNKEKALDVLRSRVYEAQRLAGKEKLDKERKGQIGTGDRSEKIRTYNFPQDRITDHRVNKSWHNIENIFEGHMDQLVSDIKENLGKRDES